MSYKLGMYRPLQSYSYDYKFHSRAPRFFFLRSTMNNKVVDIRGGDPNPGGKAIMYDQQDGYQDNQLWYEDKYGVVRSKLNDFALDSSGKFNVTANKMSLDYFI